MTVLAQAAQSDCTEEEEEARKKQQLQERIEQEQRERRAMLNKWKVLPQIFNTQSSSMVSASQGIFLGPGLGLYSGH